MGNAAMRRVMAGRIGRINAAMRFSFRNAKSLCRNNVALRIAVRV